MSPNAIWPHIKLRSKVLTDNKVTGEELSLTCVSVSDDEAVVFSVGPMKKETNAK